MPRRDDLKKIMVLGSGPIVIGQACEFDYSGTQAIKALRSEGYEVVLINSNPATIMTDPELAERTYVEPLTPEYAEKVIERERPDAILPTVGGQTALNLALALSKRGTLEKYNVELLGANEEAINVAEDRELFRQAIVRAAGNEGREIMRLGVGIRLLDSLGPPVGSAQRTDAAGRKMFVERLDDRAHGHGWIVAVEQVEVDVVCAQTGQGIVNVR